MNFTVMSELVISKVTASSTHKDEAPENVLDGNPETKWSAKGKGESLVVDLGEVKEVSGVKIKWYEGFMRKQTYELFSSSDGKTFRRIGACVSSGNKNNEYEENVFERPIKCQFVKIVGQGNDLNSFTSIVDVKILGVPNRTAEAVNAPAANPEGKPVAEVVEEKVKDKKSK
jgi:hypothetical protein